MIIWLARHGNRLDFVEPEWFSNAEKKYDPPLSEDGRIQAQQLADKLPQKKIDHLITSPFLRAVETADIIAQVLDLSIKVEAGLGEWHNADWMTQTPQIHSFSQLKSLYPRIDGNYRSYVTPKYPEDKLQVLDRMKKIAYKLVEQFSGNILLVGHSISVTGIVQGLLNSSVEINTSLCSLTKLVKYDMQWQLVLNGDTSGISQAQFFWREKND